MALGTKEHTVFEGVLAAQIAHVLLASTHQLPCMFTVY